MLELKNVDAGYGSETVLHDVNVQVAAGEIVVIVGANASGKSTLLNSILGLAEVERGSVQLCNERLDELETRRRVALGIAMSLQGGAVYPSLTVRRNLLMGPEASNDANRTRLKSLLEGLPVLEKMLERRAGTLSGGEQQLVAAGRVLIQAPRVALFDEPISGLAGQHAAALVKLIADWCKRAESAVLVAEHRVPELLKVATRIVGLKRGRVHFQLPPEDVDSNRLRELVV